MLGDATSRVSWHWIPALVSVQLCGACPLMDHMTETIGTLSFTLAHMICIHSISSHTGALSVKSLVQLRKPPAENASDDVSRDGKEEGGEGGFEDSEEHDAEGTREAMEHNMEGVMDGLEVSLVSAPH